LSILPDVHKIGERISIENPKIDNLVNNAGIYTDRRAMTADGYELTFTTNYLSPVLLTHHLIPSLCTSDNAHILNISSSAHRIGKIQWNDLGYEKNWYGFKAYGQSKLLLNMYSFILARKLKGTSIRVNAVHPGVVRTNLGSKSDPNRSKKLESILSRFITMLGISSDTSAMKIVKIIENEKYQKKTGHYFNLDKTRSPSLRSRNRRNQLRLWVLTNQILTIILNKTSNFAVIEKCV
jgi:NAD(P)-dependent dehydrogenase (short-subunit alcohol dehydrogenase family)